MNDMDGLLHGAGERWRATLPNPPEVDPGMFHADRRRWPAGLTALAGAALVVVLGLVAFELGTRSSSVGSPAASTSLVTSCDRTRPEPPFIPPDGYLSTPPRAPEVGWFGTAALWTMLDRDGEVWPFEPRSATGIPQKTFWWSANWSPDDEPEPDIVVVGTRLDEPGTFTFGPGTNASADFGTAMLVGIEIPTAGCWQLTATYHGASLSYVVLVDARPSR